MKVWRIKALTVSSLLLFACENSEPQSDTSTNDKLAVVTAVTQSGNTGNYTFSVTIESPDTGCDQYADWWEVVTIDGRLLYRRILSHSHVGEQPFTRSGGPVNISSDQDIIVRAHMNSTGYGEQVFKGNIAKGLENHTLDSLFAAELEVEDPLPGNCAF